MAIDPNGKFRQRRYRDNRREELDFLLFENVKLRQEVKRLEQELVMVTGNVQERIDRAVKEVGGV